LDGELHGHTAAETLAYLSWRSDQQAKARVRRVSGVTTTAGIDIGPRRGRGLLGRLFGGG
jgi:hypothetical protein